MTFEYAPGSFIERVDAVRETASRLEAGRGVVLVGGPGMGKTRLANHVLGLLPESAVSFRIRGTPWISGVPYGALAVLTSELNEGDFAHPLFVLKGLTRFLTDRAEGRRIILFVDNAQDLDEFSTFVISQLVVQERVVLLCACESMSRTPEEITRLWTGGSMSRLDVGPMSLNETAQLLQEELHGPISRSAVQELWSLSGGNPLFLHILTQQQLESGNLARRTRGWVLLARASAQSRQSTEQSPQSTDILTARLNQLRDKELKLAETVSLAGSLPLDVVEAIAGQQELDSLDELGILEIGTGMERSVRVKHLLVAEAIRHNVPSARACELREQLVVATSNRPYPPADALAFAIWTLQCGAPLDASLAIDAAREANDLEAPDLALRCLGALDGKQRRCPEAATEQIRAMIIRGDSIGAQELLTRLLSEVTEPSLANWVDLTLACVSLSRNAPHASPMARNALCHVLTRLEAATASGAPGLARAFEKVELAQVELWVGEGRYAEIAGILENAFQDQVTPESFRCHLGLWLSRVWSATGRQQDAIRLATNLVRRNYLATGSDETAETLLLESLLLAGRWPECFEILGTGGLKGQQHGTSAMDEVYEGILHAHSGRGSQALALLLPSIDQLWVRGQHEPAVLALAAAAYAYSLEGLPDEATALLTEIHDHGKRLSWPVRCTVDYFMTLASAPLTSPGQVTAGLLGQADECHSHGATGFELFPLSTVVRLGHHGAAERLAATAARAQGPFAELCRVYGKGIASQDPEQLLTAARMARSMGHASWCRDAASAVLALPGATADGQHLKAAKQLTLTSGGGLDQTGHRSPVPELTARERQIAHLAAKGTTSRAIADALSVSARTVEGHLYRIYAKLHIEGRAELEETLT